MPSLTPTELQEARRRSGRLGGRPRKPTVEEARQAALEELAPASIKSLRAHLGDGDPDAWRAGLRCSEDSERLYAIRVGSRSLVAIGTVS
jgi:hypothetical protein